MELIVFSYLTDFVFGDPRWLMHPVRLIGRLISFLEANLNNSGDKALQRLYGVFTALFVITVSALCAWAVIKAAENLHPLAGKIAWVFIAYTTLAIKDLTLHARAVAKQLTLNNIEGARRNLSLMVGRDTQGLPQDEVVRATVETIAESTTDGIVAPLFYLFLAGPVLAISFKAISTLDSMLGHKDERYLYFGWCAAKLDTLANFIPARITGLLIPLAALFCAKDFTGSLCTMVEDGRKQDSLNSPISEAAMAGALGLRLGGSCSYSGRIVEHPYLGRQRRPISVSMIKEAITLSIVTSLLMLILGMVIKQVIIH